MKGIINPFRRMQNKKPIFIVSGLPRSGTSLMMMMLEAAGIEPLTDHERTADNDNPRGYYEFERVKRLKDGDFDWLEDAPGKGVKGISAVLQYLPNQYQYKVLFMRRAMPEILASQRKMLINRGEDPNKISDQEMAAFFDSHIKDVIDWLGKQQNIATLLIDYNLLVRNPDSQIPIIGNFIGGEVAAERLLSAVDPELYRQRTTTNQT
jgi:hypothetical protein